MVSWLQDRNGLQEKNNRKCAQSMAARMQKKGQGEVKKGRGEEKERERRKRKENVWKRDR